MKERIIVAGHICLDITPEYKGNKVTHIEDLLRPGKLINMSGCEISTGGVVANTGLALKILGSDVLLAGKIGNDSFGKIIYDKLQERDAQDGLIIMEGESTSYSIVLNFAGIDRIFLHSSGANETFGSNDISDELIERGTHFHFGYPPIMKRMYKGSGAHLAVMLKRVQKAGLTTSLDMAAVDPDSDAAKVNWKRILANVLPFVDFFVPSFEELCFMLDPKKLDMRYIQADKDNVDLTRIISIEDDVVPLANECINMGAKVVLIKCGVQGMYYCSSGRNELRPICEKHNLNVDEWGKKKGFIRSFEPDCVLSGVGAGDTSVAAFLAAMTSGKSLKASVELAAACGAMCVTGVDALSGLISLDELEQKIQSGWKKGDLSICNSKLQEEEENA